MMRFSRTVGLLSLVAIMASTLSVRADEKIETFFPKDTDIIMSFNIEQIMSSELTKKFALPKLKEVLNSNDQMKQILGTLGLDPFTDFKRVYISMPISMTEQKGLVILEGKFDPKKINSTAEDFLKNSGDLQVEKIDGKTAFKFTPPNAPSAMYAMVVNENYILLGSEKDYLSGGAAAVVGKGKTLIEKDMASLLPKVDPKASMFLIANTKGKLGNLPIPGGNTQMIEKLESFAVELKVEKEVKLNLAMGVNDEATAEQMSTQIKQGLQLAKGFLPSAFPQGSPLVKPVTDMVSGIKTSQRGKYITLSMEATASLIEALMAGDR
jgi:hypothetical protein